jgi:hypothetical protein
MFYILQKRMIKFLFSFSLLASPLVAVEQFSLDGVKMNVVKTADNGVVNQDTIFFFSQKENVVSAEYQGGKILKGFLIGKLSTQNQLEFSYCQMQLDGKLDNGLSSCQLSKNDEGKLILIEHFEWKSRPGEFGTNIFQEL